MPFQVLEVSPTSKLRDLVELIDNHLTIVNEEVANPNGIIACAFPGIYYYHPPTEALFICRTPGDEEETVWSPIYYSINEATEDAPGIVQFANSTDVAAGTNNAKAVTPFSLANAFTLVTVHQTAVNTLQTQITSNASSISSLTNTVTSASSTPNAGKLAKYDTNGNIEVADGTAASDAVNLAQLDAVETDLQTQITTVTTTVNAASSSSSAGKLLKFDGSGLFTVAIAANAGNPVRKDTFDALGSIVTGHTSDISALDGRLDTTESDIDTAQTDISTLQSTVGKILGGSTQESLTLTSGGIQTPSKASIILDTYAAASTDDCDRLVTTNGVKFLLVQLANAARVVTLKHGQTGDGKLVHLDSADIILGIDRAVLYVLVGTEYHEVARFGYSTGGGSSGTSNYTTKSNTTYSANWGDYIDVDLSAGNVVINIPTAVGNAHKQIVIQIAVTGDYSLTVNPFAGQTINGQSSIATSGTGMAQLWTTWRITSTGSNPRVS